MNFSTKKMEIYTFGVILLVFSTILLIGCGQYEINFGTYEYFGVRITDAQNDNIDASASETAAKFTYPIDIVFSDDNVAKISTYSITYTLNYSVDNAGFVTFSGEGLETLTARVQGEFRNHGYFEDNKFFFRYKYDINTKEAYYTICVLDENLS